MYTVSVGGCYTNHPAPFKMYRPGGISEYLLLFVRTKAWFQINETSFEVLPNQILIINKNTPYKYYVTDTPYMDDWLHFDCTEDNVPFLCEILNKPIVLSNATRIAAYIRQILWEADYSSEEYRENNVDMLMHILINHIEEAVRYSKSGMSYSPYYGRMQELRLRLQSNPGSDIALDDIIKSMNVSASYFQHLYTQYFGISFRNDIISMRIEYAKELLLGTGDTIDNISRLCGYNNEVHFYRQFRKNVGITPAQYRKATDM